MTNIFSSKKQVVAELKADKETLQKTVTELTAKVEESKTDYRYHQRKQGRI